MIRAINDFRPLRPISVEDLFDGRLEPAGITEADGEPGARRLRKGPGFVDVFENAGGLVDDFRTCWRGAPILWAIADAFDTEIVSDMDHRYWGFESEEEWERFQRGLDQQREDQRYDDLVGYLKAGVTGEAPPTVGPLVAQIAAELVKAKPELLDRDRRQDLLDEINRRTSRSQAARVRLDEADLALVDYEMRACWFGAPPRH